MRSSVLYLSPPYQSVVLLRTASLTNHELNSRLLSVKVPLPADSATLD